MALAQYLKRRDGSYYARVTVPKDLAASIGKREIVKALGTRDPAEAKRRGLARCKKSAHTLSGSEPAPG